MSKVESPAEDNEPEVSVDREVAVFRYAGRAPVIVRTAHLPGEEPSREERIRAGLKRLATEGRVTLVS